MAASILCCFFGWFVLPSCHYQRDLIFGDQPDRVEEAERNIVIESNVESRDMVGFVEELRDSIAEKVPLPQVYRVHFGGSLRMRSAPGKVS